MLDYAFIKILALWVCILFLTCSHFLYVPLVPSTLRKFPGPRSFAVTKWRLAYADYTGKRTAIINTLHQRYGSAVRVGPNEISFNSLSALRTIYGAGSGFERTEFYRQFDNYGRQNMFTFKSAKMHGERKKIIAHPYSKSSVLASNGVAKRVIEGNVRAFLNLLGERREGKGGLALALDIFPILHWFSMDSITGFVYGPNYGATRALHGDAESRALLEDVFHPRRRLLSWFEVHLTRLNRWSYTRTGWTERVITALGLLPMTKPVAYTGIQERALNAWKRFEADADAGRLLASEEGTIVQRLREYQLSGKGQQLDSLDCASEAADHFLAGIDTTSDTLVFLIWQLSRPENIVRGYQKRLIDEVDAISSLKNGLNQDGIPAVEITDQLPFLDAIIKETLRLHAPLPGPEPRSCPFEDVVIDGYEVPAGTVVSIAPYTLHRNESVFPDPGAFRPERWLGEMGGDVGEMKKWFWAFSSGGRMCIGLHLAMAEMNTLVAAIYREYITCLQQRQHGVSPGITTRTEVNYDETFDKISDHTCYIEFVKR
ncbi:putative benzoate 4-monooxygenase cytochrome P450 [Xylariaceae sp. FL0255]|nr:putative benzoate 4-monooxygenase cytochrome P450 [Xylariaceae sp. FL0255]